MLPVCVQYIFVSDLKMIWMVSILVCIFLLILQLLQLVQKSFARLVFSDFLRNPRFSSFIPPLENFLIFIQLMHRWLNIDYDCSSKDEVTQEKLGPFTTLSDDESYQSRDLEKVCDSI